MGTTGAEKRVTRRRVSEVWRECLTENSHKHRMKVALGVASAVNVIIIVVDAEGLGSGPRSRTLEKILDILLGPGRTFGEWLVPGHDLGPLLFWVLCSVLFNAAVLWAILSAWAWFRKRGNYLSS